jgi:uncharacterized membrane protein YdbT with pleckstrin-like domain
MSYIDETLHEGERVIDRTHRHWIDLLGPALFVVVVAAGAAVAIPASPAPLAWLCLAAIAVVVLNLGLKYLLMKTTEFVVTNDRIIFKTGWLSRRTTEMTVANVESIDVIQSIPGRILGYGTVLIRGTGSSWEPMQRIARVIAFKMAASEAISHGRASRPE